MSQSEVKPSVLSTRIPSEKAVINTLLTVAFFAAVSSIPVYQFGSEMFSRVTFSQRAAEIAYPKPSSSE